MILAKENKPFTTKQAASMYAGRKKMTGHSIISIEGGFAILPADNVPTNPVIDKPESEAPVQTKHKVTEPWKPARVLEIPERLKNPDFVYRWANTDKKGNIRKKLSEGWEVDKKLTRQLIALQKTIDDGSGLDDTTSIRELILLRMPKEIAKSRNDYYDSRIVTPRKARQKFQQDIRNIDPRSVADGDIKENTEYVKGG